LFFAHISSIFNKSVLKSNFIIFGISMVPLVLFLQLAHNINEFFGEGMLIVHNIKNSAGIASSLSGTSILDEHTIIIIQVVLMLSGLALSVITYFKLAKNQYKRGQKSITTALWLLLLSIMFGVNFFLTFFSK
jgi:hypothetical protein